MAGRATEFGDELKRLQNVKQASPPTTTVLGEEMLAYFKNSVRRRQGKLATVAEAWETLIPAIFTEHCALDSLYRGTLNVTVDSAPHLYELRQLLDAGLQDQLVLACKSAGLRRIVLKPGIF